MTGEKEEITDDILAKRATRIVFPNVYAAKVWAVIGGAIVTWFVWVSVAITRQQACVQPRPQQQEMKK